jgi:23S rRNA pseudouridine2605 synthase
MPAERLQKIIAAAGIASRRRAEELITSGLVSVNGEIVTELGTKADPERDHIRVNGKLLHGAERHVYLLMNKPKGYVTTVSDPEGRPTVMDLLRGLGARVYPVGRLDYNSEGLLLLTNDGELANALMKAASHVQKTYLVKVAGVPSEEGLNRLRRGVTIATDGGKRVRTAPAKISSIHEANNPWYEVTLTEGKNRQIRRMFEEIGHHVEKIKRVRYGPLELDVHPGEFRRLSPDEVARLKAATKISRKAVKRAPRSQ